MADHNRLLTRLLMISLALILATLAGGLMAAYGAFITPRPHVDAIWLRDPTEVFAARNLPFGLLFAGTLTQIATIAKLALVGIVASEVFAIRSLVFQVANGGVCGFLADHMFNLGLASGLPVANGDNLLAAGLVAGATYWAVAGHTAGFRAPDDFALRAA